jgi:hypothetical protein
MKIPWGGFRMFLCGFRVGGFGALFSGKGVSSGLGTALGDSWGYGIRASATPEPERNRAASESPGAFQRSRQVMRERVALEHW